MCKLNDVKGQEASASRSLQPSEQSGLHRELQQAHDDIKSQRLQGKQDATKSGGSSESSHLDMPSLWGKDVFKSLDENHNRHVSVGEAVDAVTDSDANGRRHLHISDLGTTFGARAASVFNALDENHNGRVTVGEANKAIRSWDKNKDGKIDEHELADIAPRHQAHHGHHRTSEHTSTHSGDSSASDKPVPQPSNSGADTPPHTVPSGDKPTPAPPVESSNNNVIPGSLADVLAQNDYSLHQGKTGTNGWQNSKVPDRVTGFREWGVIKTEHGQVEDHNAKLQIKDASVYYHLKTGGWVQVEAPNQSHWWEGNFYTDFHGNLSKHGDGKVLSDGSYQFSAPPDGFLDHFGPGEIPVKFDTSLYDGVFTTMSFKADRANSGLTMQIGGDYLRPSGITQNEPGQTAENLSNPAAGGGNRMRITDNWQTAYYTSVDASVIEKDPPPGITR